MNVFKIIEENQKKTLNDSATIQIENNKYIFPYSPIDKKLVLNSSLNLYYKGPIRKKMFNIYDSDNRDFEMIENYNNKKALERLRKDKERERAKLTLALYNEDQNKNSLSSQRYINIGNFKEKLGDKMYSSEHGYNIMYMLMEFLLNKPKKAPKIKTNKKIEDLYTSKQKEFFTKKLNKIIAKKFIDSKTNKNIKFNKEINFSHRNIADKDKNINEEEKNIKNNSHEINLSKNDSYLFQNSKNNLIEKCNTIKKTKIETINQEKNNRIGYELIKNNNINENSINEQKRISENKKEINLFRRKLEKQKSKSSDFFNINYPMTQRSEIIKQINYINNRKLEKLRKKYIKKPIEPIGFTNNSIQNKSNILDLQRTQRNLLLKNLNIREKEINSKAQEISSLISISNRNYKNANFHYKTKEYDKINKIDKYKDETYSKSKITKKEKENEVKYNINNIIYRNNSNYTLSQTNRHFFGSTSGIDEIDNLKNSFTKELRKQFIKKKNNILKVNMKKIMKKLCPRYNNALS